MSLRLYTRRLALAAVALGSNGSLPLSGYILLASFANPYSFKRFFLSRHHFVSAPPLCATQETPPPDPALNIPGVLHIGQSRASHSRERGVLAEALLELHKPELLVFGALTFLESSLLHLSIVDIAEIPSLVNFAPLLKLEIPPQKSQLTMTAPNPIPLRLAPRAASWVRAT